MLEQFNEIKNFLPHREPFLFIDEIVDIELGKSIHCILKNSLEEDFYRGHFPNNPIFPGVLIIEALAQASGILGFKTMNKTPEQQKPQSVHSCLAAAALVGSFIGRTILSKQARGAD